MTVKRSFLLGAGGFLAVTGSQWCGYPGAGPLACIISAFVAGTGWRKRSAEHKLNNSVISTDEMDREDGEEIEEDGELAVVQVFEHAWTCLQPVLFAFIGTDLKFELLKNGNMVFLGLIVLAFGLVVCDMWASNITIFFFIQCLFLVLLPPWRLVVWCTGASEPPKKNEKNDKK